MWLCAGKECDSFLVTEWNDKWGREPSLHTTTTATTTGLETSIDVATTPATAACTAIHDVHSTVPTPDTQPQGSTKNKKNTKKSTMKKDKKKRQMLRTHSSIAVKLLEARRLEALRTAFGRLATVAHLSTAVECLEAHLQLGVLRAAFKQLTAASPHTSAPAAPLATTYPADSFTHIDTTTDATLNRGSAFSGTRCKQKSKAAKDKRRKATEEALASSRKLSELCTSAPPVLA